MGSATTTARGEHAPINFAGYDLVKQLGRGATGEVWTAIKRFEHSSRAEAIKILCPEFSHDPICRESFVATGGMSMQLSSANIVPVHEVGEYGGLLYLVMDRVDGVSLLEFKEHMANYSRRFSPHVAAYVLGEILGALFAAHDMEREGMPSGVIHRDVKPANIMISSTGEVRLTDFGIAMPVAAVGPRGWTAGTPGYMAPEQAQGDARRGSDLFSAGAVFHELVTGDRFRPEAHNKRELWSAATNYASVPGCPIQLPNELEYVRRRLLHPDPERRFGSAMEAMEALAKWAGYRFARPDVIKAYKTMVGGRSSGYTEAHEAAAPSFLTKWHSQLTAEKPSGGHVSTVFNGDDGATTVRRIVEDPTVQLGDRRGVGRRRAVRSSLAIRASRPPIIVRPRAERRALHVVATKPGDATKTSRPDRTLQTATARASNPPAASPSSGGSPGAREICSPDAASPRNANEAQRTPEPVVEPGPRAPAAAELGSRPTGPRDTLVATDRPSAIPGGPKVAEAKDHEPRDVEGGEDSGPCPADGQDGALGSRAKTVPGVAKQSGRTPGKTGAQSKVASCDETVAGQTSRNVGPGPRLFAIALIAASVMLGSLLAWGLFLLNRTH